MMKKTVSLLLAILMIASLSVFALADEEPVALMPEGTAVLEETAEEETVAPEEAAVLDGAEVAEPVEEAEEEPAEDGAGSMVLKVVPNKDSVAQGGTVTFDVVVSGKAASFCCMEAALEYDKDAFELVEGSWVSKLSGSTYDASVGSKLLWFKYNKYDKTQNVQQAKNATLFSFTLKATKAAVVGKEYTVTIDESEIDYDDEQEVTTTVEAATVEIASYTPGDINNDGKVNGKDVTRLKKYILDKSTEVSEGAVDVNGDGKINGKDVTRLKKYILDKTVEIH